MKRSRQFLILIIVAFGMLETAFAAGCLQATPLAIERKSAIHAGVIDQAARRYHLDRELIQAVIAVESCFNSRAVSPAGAEGLMQLMPATAERFGVSDSFNSKQNILAGARYLAWLKRRFAGNLQHAVAAYNAGEGVVAQYGGIPPYKETQRYVKNVMSIYSKLAPDKAVKHRKTIANGTVYFPYAPLNKVARHRQSGRVHMAVPKPAPLKPLTGKPGRQGIEYMRRHAPHLFRK